MLHARRRCVLAACAAGVAVLVPANPAHAHGGHGGDVSDYRVEITGIDGETHGADIDVIELGNRMQIRRNDATEIVVLGYQGEPYLRIDSRGVYENVRSPAVYLNRDRYATAAVPADADATAAPEWRQSSTDGTARWHDHRTHWMATSPPPEVQADPDREHVVPVDGTVPLLINGEPVTVFVTVTWIPPPNRWLWLAGAVAIGIGLAVVMVRGRAWTGNIVAVAMFVTGIALLPSQGLGEWWWPGGIGIALIGLSAWPATATARAVLGAIVVGNALLYRTIYEHALVDVGSPTFVRVGLAASLALGLALAAGGVVEAFRPSSRRPQPAPG